VVAGRTGGGAPTSVPPDRFPDMVRALDEGVGRMLAALDESGLAERTLVIFTSDNGGVQHSSMGALARARRTSGRAGSVCAPLRAGRGSSPPA
jgi:arylsulfatase A-like enzyme